MSLFVLFITGCANERVDNATLAEIREKIRTRPNPLEIYQADSSKEVDYRQGDAAEIEVSSDPILEVIPASGSVVNANPRAVKRAGGTGKGTVTLNFEGADLREVVKFIMTDLLELNYIMSPNVQGQVTLQTSKPVTESDLLPTLETLLKINGAVLVDDGSILRVLPMAEANRGNLVPKVGKISTQKPGYEVRIIPLKYISAAEAQTALEPFLPDGSLLQVDTARNILTVGGSSSELANIQETVDTFDVDWLKGMSIGIFKLRNTDLTQVIPELEGLFGESGNTPFAGLFRFVPMERMNAIMLITPQPTYLKEAERWIEKLDQAESVDSERLYVYRVQHGRASDLIDVLSGIFKGTTRSSSSDSSSSNRDSSVAAGESAVSVGSASTTKTTATSNTKTTSSSSSSKSGNSISDAEATISADEVNNSLVIKATPANYDLVLQALRQLDVPKLQVLLDVVIAEINLTDELRYGFRYWLSNSTSDNTIGVGGGGAGDRDVSVSSIVGGLASGFNYAVTNTNGNLNFALDALASEGLAQFLSTPSLMVLDNETATMNVGEEISVNTGSSTSDGGTVTTSNQYIQTGVDLEVTPRVSASGAVILDITQSVSRESGQTGSSGNPNIYDREIATSISALDGQTIALGGLIQEQRDTGRSGVPLLKDIPYLGAIFRGTSKKVNRTELIVLVTPRVARNSNETLEITQEFRSRMRGLDAYNDAKNRLEK